jgi:ABC-2 type transport system ATP-binding protein
LLRDLARQGRTVLVSSHLMSEMAVTADRLLIIGRGRLLADTGVDELIDRVAVGSVLVRSPDLSRLRALLERRGATATEAGDGALRVSDASAEQIGDLARDGGLTLSELTPRRASLEEAYMELTRDAVQFETGNGAGK